MSGKRRSNKRHANSKGNKASQSLPPTLETQQDNKSTTKLPDQSARPLPNPKLPASPIVKGWKLLLQGVAVVVPLLLAVYVYRPILQVNSIGHPHPYSDNVSLTLTSSGFPISNVSVECVTNKVIMANKFTLELHHIATLDQYDVPEVKTGESFNIECPLQWYVVEGGGLGYYIWGRPDLSPHHMVIPFRLTKDLPVATTNGRPMSVTFNDLSGYTVFPPTAVEGMITVRFNWKHTRFTQQRNFRVIGHPDNNGEFSWVSAPESQELIPDAPDVNGIKLTVDQSSGDFAFHLKRSQ